MKFFWSPPKQQRSATNSSMQRTAKESLHLKKTQNSGLSMKLIGPIIEYQLFLNWNNTGMVKYREGDKGNTAKLS